MTWITFPPRPPDATAPQPSAPGNAGNGSAPAADNPSANSSAEKTRARDVLRLLREPSASALETLDQVLSYLDVNAATRLDPRETEMCVQILQLAGRTAHDDGRVSAAAQSGRLILLGKNELVTGVPE